MRLILFLVTLFSSGVSEANPIAEEADSCQQAASFVSKAEDAKAYLYLERCQQTAHTPDRKKSLETLTLALQVEHAPIALLLSPDTARATLSGALDGITLKNNDELWLHRGVYVVTVQAKGFQTATFSLEVDSLARSIASFSIEEESPADTHIEVGENSESELGQVSHLADTRPKEFKTLLARRYAIAPDPILPPPLPKTSSPPWSAISGGLALGALGGGVALQAYSHPKAAWVSYGAAALLTGLSLWQLYPSNSKTPSSPTVRLQARPSSLFLQVHSRW